MYYFEILTPFARRHLSNTIFWPSNATKLRLNQQNVCANLTKHKGKEMQKKS